MKPKKGISDVISTVLIILLIMVTIPSIYFVVKKLVSDSGSALNQNIISVVKFELSKPDSDDLLNDRFWIKNTGQTLLSGYSVYIDDELQDLVLHKQINALERESLYLANPYPVGVHKLKVLSQDYSQTVTFTADEEDHITIDRVEVLQPTP
ncbi:hypothetical protein COU53_00185 [Candidatus Pacearchaeota archaeon CG10_big_fil_rev_8_21_14_0_10_30_48]|nr:MAG: hypothetical protein COU53_00185 [Candidatus Pacearchaeota archaeon CG10_big_fil_rev_8_21_14_0_10_30_48]